MKNLIWVGFGFSLLWIAIKYIAFAIGYDLFGSVSNFVLLNMFFLTSSISIGLFIFKKQETEIGDFFQDLRTAMVPGMIYTVMVSGFIYLFYSSIHPEYNAYQVEKSRVWLNDKKNLDQMRENDASLSSKSDQEIKAMKMKQTKQIANAGFSFVVSLLGLTLYCILNSLAISLIYRLVLFRRP